MNFIYENREVKVGDLVHPLPIELHADYSTDETYFKVNNEILNNYNNMQTLMYVISISHDKQFIGVSPNKGKEHPRFPMKFPTQLFRIVKVPKFQDIVQWLWDCSPVSKPNHWTPFKNEIKSIVRFLPKLFQNHLRVLHYINSQVNHIYSRFAPDEILMFYKMLIQVNRIPFDERYIKYTPRTKRQQFIKTCLEIRPDWHTNDALSFYELNRVGVLHEGDYRSNDLLLDMYLNPKKYELINAKKNKEKFEKDLELIQQAKVESMTRKMMTDDRFLKELNQDIIDELNLTIFNVKTLKSRNQILFIFIDKDNNKRFYVQNLEYRFFISIYQNIIDNDYIVHRDPNIHKEFVITDYNIIQTLKFGVSDNYKKFMKYGKM